MDPILTKESYENKGTIETNYKKKKKKKIYIYIYIHLIFTYQRIKNSINFKKFKFFNSLIGKY